jgi:hypothetical protein
VSIAISADTSSKSGKGLLIGRPIAENNARCLTKLSPNAFKLDLQRNILLQPQPDKRYFSCLSFSSRSLDFANLSRLKSLSPTREHAPVMTQK